MAIKNYIDDYKDNPIQYRLISLMKESKAADNPGKLAKELLERGYLTGYSFDTESTKAIDNVRKKIERQLNLEKPTEITAEFLLAYSSYFTCSTDYLLCKTDVRTPNMDVRGICDKTGLSESIILDMIRYPQAFKLHDIKYVNQLLQAKHFIAFLDAMQDCDKAINDPNSYNLNMRQLSAEVDQLNTEFETKYSEKVKRYARDHWDDYYPPDEELPDFMDSDVLDAIHDFNDIFDKNLQLESEIENIKKICLFDLSTCYQRLIDEIFNLGENAR